MVDRPLAVGQILQKRCEQARREVRDHDERNDHRLAVDDCRNHGEHEPDDAVAPDVRERDEERVERLGPVVDYPPLQPLIESDQTGRICFA